MFFFKTITLHNPEKKDIETAIRKFSSRRKTSLDFKSSASYISSEKYFLGFETDIDLQLTRIRTPFERFFPKLILNFPKDKQFTCYKIRYSFLSAIIFIALSIVFILSLIYSIIDQRLDSDLLSITFFLCMFLILTSIEYLITRLRIKMALK
jgi:hypothetical protein